MIRTGFELTRRALLALALLSHAAAAQDAPTALLRLSPRVGDTLHTSLEQQTEVSATVPGNAPRTVTTSLAIHSRTIVRSVKPMNTTVLTIVDSAAMTSTDAHATKMVADAERALTGQQLVLQLGSDGTVESARDKHGVRLSRDLVDAMSAMPAVFPKKAVAVGQQWTREMPLPAGGPLGAGGGGRVRATFRLDSLEKGGTLAYVSMRGDIVADSAGKGAELSGSVTGSMLLDRARGWMTDSRFIVTLRSIMSPPASLGIGPMKFVTKVTQRLRTQDKR